MQTMICEGKGGGGTEKRVFGPKNPGCKPGKSCSAHVTGGGRKAACRLLCLYCIHRVASKLWPR